jgi:hypothetical protein
LIPSPSPPNINTNLESVLNTEVGIYRAHGILDFEGTPNSFITASPPIFELPPIQIHLELVASNFQRSFKLSKK